MKSPLRYTLILALTISLVACQSDGGADSPFTGNEVSFTLIPGEVEGNTTTGTLTIKERTDGRGEIEITLNGVIQGAEHPVHLHFGNLSENDLVATYLNDIQEIDGVGKSSTTLQLLDDGTQLQYSDLVSFDGSVKIHFEATGSLKDAVLGSTNIGINSSGNEAFLSGVKSITVCNSDFVGN